jgi:hypothetical protein
MALFEYVVWFRDESLPPDDQDFEWPACFLVEALSDTAAQKWGDHLAGSYATRTAQVFLWSRVDAPSGSTGLPIVREGELASDSYIGW